MDLPRFMPSTAGRWPGAGSCWRSRVRRNTWAPPLLKPMRLSAARSAAKRNSRGLGLPGWPCQVTVPSSAKPKPNKCQIPAAKPFLSNPAARPTGLAKRQPNRVCSSRGSGRCSSAARPARAPLTKGHWRRKEAWARAVSVIWLSCSASAPSSRASSGPTSRSYKAPVLVAVPESTISPPTPARPILPRPVANASALPPGAKPASRASARGHCGAPVAARAAPPAGPAPPS